MSVKRNNSFSNPNDIKPFTIDNKPSKNRNMSISTEIECLEDEPIFKKVCDEKNYSKSGECEICKKNFGIFKHKKNCEFCGRALCKSHLIKKRQDPNNTEKFLKICEICEEKYLNKMIWDEFNKKKKRRDEENKQAENQLNQVKSDLSLLQIEYQKLNSLKEENDKIFQEKLAFLNKNISKKRQMTEKLEEENKILNDKDLEINKKIKEENLKGIELQSELEKIKQLYESQSNELQKTETEIKRLNALIEDTEQKLSYYKYNNRKSDNTDNEIYANSLISNGEGSIVMKSSIGGKRKSVDMKNVEETKPCCILF